MYRASNASLGFRSLTWRLKHPRSRWRPKASTMPPASLGIQTFRASRPYLASKASKGSLGVQGVEGRFGRPTRPRRHCTHPKGEGRRRHHWASKGASKVSLGIPGIERLPWAFKMSRTSKAILGADSVQGVQGPTERPKHPKYPSPYWASKTSRVPKA